MFKVHNKTTKSDQLDNSKSFALTVRCDAIQKLLKALMTTHTHHEVTKRIIMCHCGQLLFLSSDDRPVQSLDLAASSNSSNTLTFDTVSYRPLKSHGFAVRFTIFS